LPKSSITKILKHLPVQVVGQFIDDYRLRLGDYRVIYTIEGVILAIIKIGPRGDVYKK